MIRLVQEIKAEEAALNEKLSAYETYIFGEDGETYQSLLASYAEFRRALVYRVSGSAASRTQEGYLSDSARELADYLSRVIAGQLERSVQAGQQYREDSDYIGRMSSMAGRNGGETP